MAKTYIAFRVDASNQIGTGHFMRCLTLADELKKQRAQIRFISRNLPRYLIDMLTEKGMEYLPLSLDDAKESVDELLHANWLGTSQARDAQATVEALANQLWDWIIVDHYALDERWESSVRESCKKLMVIDDLADRQHDCDLLLDQNYYADMQKRYSGKVPVHCQLLLGSRYALLREEFRILREQIKPRTGEVKKILVFFGGVDANNYTSLAIQALAELKCKQQVDVVIGAQHPKREQIQEACIKYCYVCHVQTSKMAELIAEADLGIGAGGSVMWERCYLGLPTITVVSAANQVRTTEDVAAIGAIEYLGRTNELKKIDYINAIRKMLANPTYVKQISEVAFSALHRVGTFDVVNEIFNLADSQTANKHY